MIVRSSGCTEVQPNKVPPNTVPHIDGNINDMQFKTINNLQIDLEFDRVGIVS